MILGLDHFGIIQTAERDIDFSRKIVKLARQWGPAGGAKAPRALGGGSEPCRLTSKEPEAGFGHAEPGDEGSPTCASTNRTVAIGFMKGQLLRLVANNSTKTPTLQHTLAPFKLNIL
jgi:hypothetical protein